MRFKPHIRGASMLSRQASETCLPLHDVVNLHQKPGITPVIAKDFLQAQTGAEGMAQPGTKFGLWGWR